LFLVWRKNVRFAAGGGVEMHVVPRHADEAVVALARRQHGVITARQLLEAGVGPNAVTSKVARGWLRRVHRGVYAVGALESELTAPTAALAAYGQNAVLSHRTAAVLWRLLPARPDDPVDITLLDANRRSRPGVTVHRARHSVVRRRHGLRLTSPAQTLADLPPGELERAYNEALVLGLVTHQEVRAFAARTPALRAIVEENPGMTRSRMERALRALIKQAGLPAPETNVRVHGHEVDMYGPAARLVVEFDGWNTHSSRTAFESDRFKDAALQLAGERVVRVTGRQLERRREELVARLATAISAFRPPRPPLVN
jgi:very-short-patch-repair endonuclease